MQRPNASAIIRLCGPTIHRQLLSVISVESFVLRRKCWSWGDRRSIFSNVSSHTLQPRHKAAFCSVQFKALHLCFLCFLASGLSQISTCSDEARLIFFGQWTLKWTSCNLFRSLVCCRCWGEAWNLLVQLDLWAKRSCNLRFVTIHLIFEPHTTITGKDSREACKSSIFKSFESIITAFPVGGCCSGCFDLFSTCWKLYARRCEPQGTRVPSSRLFFLSRLALQLSKTLSAAKKFSFQVLNKWHYLPGSRALFLSLMLTA